MCWAGGKMGGGGQQPGGRGRHWRRYDQTRGVHEMKQRPGTRGVMAVAAGGRCVGLGLYSEADSGERE